MSILIISTYLRLGLPSGVFPSGFHTDILHAFYSFPMHATCLVNLKLFNHVTPILLGEEHKL
jgi:hypothetical protein